MRLAILTSITLTFSTAAMAATPQGRVLTPNGWRKSVAGIKVAQKHEVTKAITEVVRERYGDNARFEISLSPLHPINLSFATPEVTRYARVFGELRVDGARTREVIVDATAGKVQAFISGGDADRLRMDDALLTARGLPTMEAQFEARRRTERTEPMLIGATLNTTPAYYAMGFGNGKQATLVAVNGKAGGFTVPALVAHPIFDLWANAWGFTRIK